MKNLLTPKAASHVKTINPKAHRSIPFKLNAVSHGLAYTFLAFSLSSIAPVFAQNNGTNGSGTTAGHGGAGVSGSGSGGNGGSGPTRSGGVGGVAAHQDQVAGEELIVPLGIPAVTVVLSGLLDL